MGGPKSHQSCWTNTMFQGVTSTNMALENTGCRESTEYAKTVGSCSLAGMHLLIHVLIPTRMSKPITSTSIFCVYCKSLESQINLRSKWIMGILICWVCSSNDRLCRGTLQRTARSWLLDELDWALTAFQDQSLFSCGESRATFPISKNRRATPCSRENLLLSIIR